MSRSGSRRGWLLWGVLGALACGTSEVPPAAPTPVAGAGVPAAVPRIERIEFVPRRPQPGDRVAALVELARPEAEAVRLDFVWRLDGFRQPERGPNFEIPRDARGRRVEVMVIARDGLRESDPVRKRVSVSNQRPTVYAVALEVVGRLDTEASVGVTVRAEDPDGDPLDYEYTWMVNDRRVEVTGSQLPASYHRRGDEVQAEVVASDGALRSPPRRSSRVSVGNAPPRILSEPGSIGEDGVFRYRIEVRDPDADSLFGYRLVESPRGMRMDLAGGVIQWAPHPEQAGTHRVVVEVDDRHGAIARQEFDLWVGIEDAPLAGL